MYAMVASYLMVPARSAASFAKQRERIVSLD